MRIGRGEETVRLEKEYLISLYKESGCISFKAKVVLKPKK